MSINVLLLKNTPIYKQLEIEEALLRTDHQNWCILNQGSSKAIVLGISGKKEELIDLKTAKSQNVLLIKRFSGGGTVVVDEDTLFSSFIFQQETLDFPPYPEYILRWTAEFYKNALKIPKFSLVEHDYALGDKKCAGNAQYLKKDRWLHHTTFLYDFKPSNMELLLYPKKVPVYREGRSHLDFLCTLKEHLSNKKAFEERMISYLKGVFEVKFHTYESLLPILEKDYRKTLTTLDY